MNHMKAAKPGNSLAETKARKNLACLGFAYGLFTEIRIVHGFVYGFVYGFAYGAGQDDSQVAYKILYSAMQE